MKVAIFDFDETLVHGGYEPPIECVESLAVVKYLHKKGFIICLATLNEYAHELCEQTSFNNYVDSIVALDTDDYKYYHFNKILDYYGCEPEDCIFFDDIIENIECARKLGIKAKKVNYKKGVTMNNVLSVLKKFGK